MTKYNFTLILFCIFGSLFCQVNSSTNFSYNVHFTCAPCGCPEDGKKFNASGACPTCNMPLRAVIEELKDKPRNSRSRIKVGLFLFNGADVMDVTGPLSVFEHAGFELYFVAKDKREKSIGMHTSLQPDYSFSDMPKVDILVIPGGDALALADDPEIQKWIKNQATEVSTLFSICSGAFFLGRAGLLAGQEATTFASLIPHLTEEFPEAIIRDDVKYTMNHQIVCSSGLSSGIDASFAVVAKYLGEGRAQDIANHMEYSWTRQKEYARSFLADHFILPFRATIAPFSVKYLSSDGDADRWKYEYQLWDQVNIPAFKNFIIQEWSKINFDLTAVGDESIRGHVFHPRLGKGNIELILPKKEDDYKLILQVVKDAVN